jgi:hypothetical protein
VTASELAGELLPRLRRWTARTWAVPATAPVTLGPRDGAAGAVGTRADVAAAVVQRLADLGADTEGRPRRVVPRLEDTVLADQLAVLADDLLRTGSPAAEAALAAELTALRAALGVR